MITGISGGPYVYISDTTAGGAVGYTPNSNPLSGSVRYNQYGQVEVYDGYNWRISSQNPQINLSFEAQEAIAWALKKMKEEKELEELAKSNPAIKAAVKNLKSAEEQLKTTIILSRDEQKTTS